MAKRGSKKSTKSKKQSKLMLYNTLGRRCLEFKPIKRAYVGMYVCGPTLYDYAHIGNFRAYVVADLLRRYLEFKNWRVRQVMNLTDVDDKTIKGSRKEGVSLRKYTNRYKKAFFEDLSVLNIEPAAVYPEATAHIKEMVELIKVLLDKGIAYKSEDGIYFDIAKFRDYGKLSGLDLSELKALKVGASKRVSADEYEKKAARDFVLWKFWKQEDGDVFWSAGLGKGRPGWHIECSAMSMKYLGKSFDIHTGGVDLVFPHHENEIAQSEAFTGKKVVKYWIHNEHLLVDGKKMSKSLVNFYNLRDLIAKGYRPEEIRFFLISTHYRKKLNLTFKALDSARESVKRMLDFLLNSLYKKDSEQVEDLIEKAEKEFVKAMDADLNVPDALAAVFNFIREANKAGAGDRSAAFILRIDDVLGLGLRKIADEEEKVPPRVMKLAAEREESRDAKDWKKSDELRERIKEAGWYVDDTAEGPKLKKILKG